jgi:SAM-dependent methyltransferase
MQPLPEINAAERAWNSATTLYIARKLQEIAAGQRLHVLDMGCGEGTVISSLIDYGHVLHGFDLPDRAEALRTNMKLHFGGEYASRIRIMQDERRIPFDSARFDVVYANQVFEHVRFLDQMVAECARVLKPGGALIALFPLATYPLEGHVLVPFAHWLPPGRVRRSYLRTLMTFGIGRRLPGRSVSQAAREWDERLRLYTFYRFINELEALFNYYFDHWSLDTGNYVRAKADLLQASASAGKRALGRILERLPTETMASLVTYGFNAVFVARGPKPTERRGGVMAWRH